MNQFLTKKLNERARALKGIQTIDSIMKAINVNRSNAIRIVSALRKRGFAITIAGGRKPRLYRIGTVPIPREPSNDLYYYLSKKSNLPLAVEPKRILHKEITPETALIEALKDNDFRVWLSSLALFRSITNWKLLAENAIKEHLGRLMGAFYEAARKVIRVRKMPKSIRKKLLKEKISERFSIISENLDFANIEKIWNVRIPFRKGDIERLK